MNNNVSNIILAKCQIMFLTVFQLPTESGVYNVLDLQVEIV